MFWFEKESYRNFHAALLKDINALSLNGGFTDSSYNNDACGSVMYEIDRDKETYVQLFAFETKADALLDLGEKGKQYGISICRNGEARFDGWEGDDREEAMAQAIKAVEALLEIGFVHEGIHIVNIKEDSSGFPHEADDAIAEYRDTIASLVKESKPTDLDWLCLVVQNAIGQTDGGHAGIWWSGAHADGIQELQDEIGSSVVTDSIPDDILLEYIEYEIHCYFQEDK